MENQSDSKIEIDELGKLVGLLTAGTFCLSVLFDWGYLEGLGLSFTSVPTTIADHVRDALLWVPGVLTAVVAYVSLELMSRRIEGGLSDEEIVGQSKNPRLTSWLRRSPYKAFVVMSILIIFLNYLFGDAFARGMSLATPLMMYEVIRWSFAHKRVADRFSPLIRKVIMFIIPVSFFMYFTGYAKAIDQLAEKPTTLLVLSSAPQPTEVTLLRQMEKGVLVKDKAGQAIFYRWEVIKSVSISVVSPTGRNRMCKWVGGVFCSFPS